MEQRYYILSRHLAWLWAKSLGWHACSTMFFHTPSGIQLHSYKRANCTHWLKGIGLHELGFRGGMRGSHSGRWQERLVLPLRTVSRQALEDPLEQVVTTLGWTSKQIQQKGRSRASASYRVSTSQAAYFKQCLSWSHVGKALLVLYLNHHHISLSLKKQILQ